MREITSNPLIMTVIASVLSTVFATVLIAVSVRSFSLIQEKLVHHVIAPRVLAIIQAALQAKGYPSEVSPETVKKLQSFADDELQEHKETVEDLKKRVGTLGSQMTGAGAQLGKAGELIEEAGKQIKNAGKGSPRQSGSAV